MKKVRSNYYNILVPIEEEQEWILYNTLTGGMEVLNAGDGAFLSRLIDTSGSLDTEQVMASPFLTYLYERDYLTDEGEPEREKFVRNYVNKQAQHYDREVADIGLTIGTTITCNMGCAYCFEFEKPNKSLRSDANVDAIISYLEDMIAKAPVKKWRKCLVVWYGGEPLINAGAIEKLSPKLLAFCEKHDIGYGANIITNGLLLNEKTWDILQRCHVNDLQITIDGPEELHNRKRPLKATRGENYKKILSNIAMMPEGMEVTIRINVDRDIAARWDEFFNDLYNYGIWPQRYRSVNFAPSWLRPYEEITNNTASSYLTNEEFFDVQQDFRRKKVELYNKWAEANGLPKAKLKWTLPTFQEDCATWVSPYNVVIDPEGYIQKCWETIHDSKYHIHHVSEGWKPKDFIPYSSYNKIELNDMCKNCQYLPVCDKLPCAFEASKTGKPVCSYWKTKLPESLHDQYLLMKRSPELLVPPALTTKGNTGHSNK